jgi:hypothetical protein
MLRTSPYNYDSDFVNNEIYGEMQEDPDLANAVSQSARQDAKSAIDEALDALNTIYVSVNQTCTATHKMQQPPCPQGLKAITDEVEKLVKFADPIELGFWKGKNGTNPVSLPMTVRDLVELKIHIRKEVKNEIALVRNLFEREHMSPPAFSFKKKMQKKFGKLSKKTRKLFKLNKLGSQEVTSSSLFSIVGSSIVRIAMVILLFLVLIFFISHIFTTTIPTPSTSSTSTSSK